MPQASAGLRPTASTLFPDNPPSSCHSKFIQRTSESLPPQPPPPSYTPRHFPQSLHPAQVPESPPPRHKPLAASPAQPPQQPPRPQLTFQTPAQTRSNPLHPSGPAEPLPSHDNSHSQMLPASPPAPAPVSALPLLQKDAPHPLRPQSPHPPSARSEPSSPRP